MAVKVLNVYLKDERTEVFLYDSFFEGKTAPSPLHTHRYAEIHITTRGEAEIMTPSGEYASGVGTVTVIPAGALHKLNITHADTRHRAFLINFPADAIYQKTLSRTLTEEIECALYRNEDDVYSYITLICQSVLKSEMRMYPVDNREFLINEFFANRYDSDVSIRDLASELNLCPKQTARLVEKYMGASFSRVLTEHRITAAKILMDSNEALTLSEIAQTVGYGSYSGFWKAFKSRSECSDSKNHTQKKASLKE